MNAGKAYGEAYRIIAHGRQTRRGAAINAFITRRKSDPSGRFGRGIPTAMQRRLLAQAHIIPQRRADKFHPLRVNIIIGQKRRQIAQCQAAFGQKHRIIGNIAQCLGQFQRLISRRHFRCARAYGAKQGIGFCVLGQLFGGQAARRVNQPGHLRAMRGGAAVKLRQAFDRLKHLCGFRRIGFDLHHRATKARHFGDKTVANAATIGALRQQRAKAGQPLRDRFGDDLRDVLFRQKPHQPNIVARRAAIIGQRQSDNIAACQHRRDGCHRGRKQRPDYNIGLTGNRRHGGCLRARGRAFRIVQF